jgi:hypothetical protein
VAGSVFDDKSVMLLEAALVEYVERFGLTPKARLALMTPQKTSREQRYPWTEKAGSSTTSSWNGCGAR